MSTGDIVPLDKRTPGIGSIDALIRPRLADLYARRGGRLAQLAEAGHEDADYLRFAAALVSAQAQLLASDPPGPEEDGRASVLDVDALDAAMLEADGRIWRTLDALLERLDSAGVDPAAAEQLDLLYQAGTDTRAAWALALLQGRYDEADSGVAVPLWAALSLVWAQRAGNHVQDAAPEHSDGMPEEAPVCPVCATVPVGSLILTGDRAGLRYLQCALCETRWHMVRAKCSNCDSAAKLQYLSLDSEDAPVKAESCGDCGGYLKVFYLEREPAIDMVADDLATLDLDDAVTIDGFQRTGLNPFALPA